MLNMWILIILNMGIPILVKRHFTLWQPPGPPSLTYFTWRVTLLMIDTEKICFYRYTCPWLCVISSFYLTYSQKLVSGAVPPNPKTPTLTSPCRGEIPEVRHLLFRVHSTYTTVVEVINAAFDAVIWMTRQWKLTCERDIARWYFLMVRHSTSVFRQFFKPDIGPKYGMSD